MLTVKGFVQKIVDISPEAVLWEGKPGEKMEAEITIVPKKNYDFSILSLTQLPGSKFSAKLISPDKKGDPWKIKVETDSDKPDSFYDSLTLKTDSQHKKELIVRVYATFLH